MGGVLKGLIEVTIKKLKVNMFNKSGDIYNIEKVEIKIDVHVTLPEEQVKPLEEVTAHETENKQQ